MISYPSIPTVWSRDPATKYKTLIQGEWATPELAYLADLPWTWTEKVDGTNIRVSFSGEGVLFGGRTDNAQLPTPLLTRLMEMFPPRGRRTKFDGLTLFGEGYGKGIQKAGTGYSSEQSFILFDVWGGKSWLSREDTVYIAQEMGIPCVPVIGEGTLLEAIHKVMGGLASQVGGCPPAEGLVMRPLCELNSRTGERIITKVKCRDFRGTPHA